ncbi:MAG: NusG domain II-containing protein [Nitrospinales bacterium]
MEKKINLTRWDKILIAALLVVNGLLFLQMDFSASQGEWVVIESNQQEVQRLPLMTNQVVHVEGRLGHLEVEIRDGKARVTRSSCPNQVCVKSGAIQYADRLIACVPNRVVIRIEGRRQRGVDAVVG